MNSSESPLAIVVIGASGDLAQRKIMPALFSLFARDLLPSEFAVYGFARSAMDDDTFRESLAGSLACRYTPASDCESRKRKFLEHCRYTQGQYDEAADYLELYRALRRMFPGEHPNILYYLAIPPSVFLQCARALGDSGMTQCGDSPFWMRAVIEKPFGHDRRSSDRLVSELATVFRETDTYRIDHYLGKEIVQNLLVLRFANSVFEPLWNRDTIERIDIDWRETYGVKNRASYFDRYGIIRDVVQNHLLQIVALIGMEQPAGRTPDRIRDAKVSLLRAVNPATPDSVRLGQYTAGEQAGLPRRGYRDEDGVPAGSTTPTYARVALTLNHPRWHGVPFVINAGKAMDADRTEIRIVFREPATPWCDREGSCGPANCLIIRVQPNEAIRLRVVTKEPGMTQRTVPTDLQLVYGEAFPQTIPEAYERLLLDVIHGDKSLFIRKDELAAAWDVFTPLLDHLKKHNPEPEPYPFGSDGPR